MHHNTWNCFPGDTSLHHSETESLIRLVQPCLKHPVALIYVHGCFYKVDHCWTRLKSFLKVADPQIHELKFRIVIGDSKLSPWTIWILSAPVLMWKGNMNRTVMRIPSHHCPERSHYLQPIPSPRIQNYAYHLSSCTIFSKIDLTRAYHQIPAHTDDIKTAITTPFGLFEFPCMSFGLRNCPKLSTFYGRNPTRLGFLLHLSGRHPCL